VRNFDFWRGFGEGAGLKNPVTEPKRLSAVALTKAEAKNQKDRCPPNRQHIATAFMETLQH
jgi:hypothetical protein